MNADIPARVAPLELLVKLPIIKRCVFRKKVNERKLRKSR